MKFILKKFFEVGNVKYLYLTILCLLITSISLSSTPVILKYLADQFESGVRGQPLLTIFIIFCGVTLLSRITNELKFYIFAKWEYGLFANTLNDFYEKMIVKEAFFHKIYKPGSLSAMIFQSAQGIRIFAFNLILHILPLFIEFIIVGISLYAFMNVKIAAVLIVGFGLYLSSLVYFNPLLIRYQRKSRESQVEAEGSLTELMRAWKDIQSYQSFKFAKSIFSKNTAQLTRSNIDFFKMRTKYGVIQSILIAVTIIWANYLTLQQPDSLVIGGLILVNGYIFQLLRPLEHFGLIYRSILGGYADFIAIFPHFKSDNKRALTRQLKSIDRIEFKDVSCNSALKSLDLTISKGDKIAIIGPSGCGKTTLVELITKFRDLEEGDILINGISISEFDTAEIRKHIAYMSKDSHLLPSNISSNIYLGDNAPQSAKLYNLYEEIAQIDMLCKQSYLSAGEEQRILLSRAIYQNKPILILDESLSSLNPALADSLLNEVILPYEGTVIYVTHNHEHAEYFPKIIELSKDKIEEKIVNG